METKRRRWIEWGKNVLIVALTLSAIWLVKQATPYEGFSLFAPDEGSTVSAETKATGSTEISVEPSALVVQNAAGRYGLAYDSRAIKDLFETKLGILLREALAGAEKPTSITKTQWQRVISGQDAWIYYDFLSDLPLERLPLWLGNTDTNELLSGEARRFLLCKSETAYLLYYQNEYQNSYFVSELTEERVDRFFTAIEGFVPNEAFFAFEAPDPYEVLDDNHLLLSSPPSMLAYEATNPLAVWDNALREDVLRSLDFNPNTAKAYEPAGGWAFKEGTDSLRILQDGTIFFESQGNDQARYPISAENRGLLIEQLQSILVRVMGTRCGEAAPYLSSVQESEDGSLTISFGYRLNGAPVKVFSEGYAARFFVQDGRVKTYTIHLRSYTRTEEKLYILPERQTVAVIASQGPDEAKITASYVDMGEEGPVRTDWIPH